MGSGTNASMTPIAAISKMDFAVLTAVVGDVPLLLDSKPGYKVSLDVDVNLKSRSLLLYEIERVIYP